MHSFACGYPVIPAPFSQETVLLPHSMNLAPLLKINWTLVFGFISEFQSQ